MSSVVQKHLERARSIAQQSTCRQKHGVVVAKGNRVVAVAVNTYRNHPCNVTDPKTESTYHAERNALWQIFPDDNLDYGKLTLYSVRINRSGQMVLAKPCKRCQELIDNVGIKTVYHS